MAGREGCAPTYQEVSHEAKSLGAGALLAGSTSKQYNVSSELIRFEDEEAAASVQKNRVFANNAFGQVVTAIAGDYGDNVATNAAAFRTALEPSTSSGADNSQMNRYWNGQQLGTFGYLQRETIAFSANFDVNYTPISDHYPTATPSEVTVQQGDTLRAIAQRLFGDGSLWYVIADANGLQMGPDDELVDQVGWPLRVPNEVVSMSNTATSFKPFNLADVLGDTSPTQPAPPPPPRPKKKGCGVVGQILMIVVAIVVTWATYGAATNAVAGAWASLGTTGSAIAGGAIAGAAGSLASQAVGIAIGAQDEFSWKAVAASALTGGLLKGPVGNLFGAGAEGLTQLAVQGAVNSAVSQGVSIALGLQESFSWKQVAISAVAAPIAHRVGEHTEKFGTFISSVATGVSSALVRSTIGGKIDTDAVLADVFGNALGNSIVDGMTPRAVTRSNEIGITDEQWAQADQLLSAEIAAGQGQFNGQLRRDLRQQQFQVSLQRDIERSLNNNPEFVANVPMPRAEFNVPIAPPRPDPYLATARAQVGDFWRDGVREASYSSVDRQFADAFDGLLARPVGAPPRAVPGQQMSDALYLAGPIPIARHDLGIASLTVNGALNFVNGVANAGMNALGALAEPLDRYQGELTSIETGLGPMGAAAVAPTLLLGRLSSAIRAEGALNARFLSNGRLALESDQAALAQKISFEPSLTTVDRYFGMQAGEIIAADPTARAFYTRLQAQGTDIRFVNDTSLEAMGVFDGYRNSVTVNLAEHSTAQEVVSTLIHEGTHQSRFFRGARLGTQYEEYVAFRSEALFNLGRRPTLVERQVIWKDVQHLYPELPSGPVPFGGQR